jgi:hypothetical protein
MSLNSNARIALSSDLDTVMEYLSRSRIYERSARKYVKSWHWYSLDASSMKQLATEGRVALSGEPVEGMAVLNTAGYWNRRGVLQVVYLDSESEDALQDLLAFVTNKYVDGGYERLQILCPRDEKMISKIEAFDIQESERFLLYSKVFSG